MKELPDMNIPPTILDNADDIVTPTEKVVKKGFQSFSEEKRKEVSSKGGRVAQQKGTAHKLTPDEVREGGKKGGETVSKDRDHMADLGRIGGSISRGGGRPRKK